MSRWTEEEDQVLVRMYGKVGNAELARRVGRSATATRHRATLLGLTASLGRRDATGPDDPVIRDAFNAWRCGNPGAQLSWRV